MAGYERATLVSATMSLMEQKLAFTGCELHLSKRLLDDVWSEIIMYASRGVGFNCL